MSEFVNTLSANPMKWSNKKNLSATADELLPTNCLSAFDHFVGLALKWLTYLTQK